MTKKQSKPWEDDQAYQALILDIKDHPFVTDLKAFKQHIYGNRLTHSYHVSYLGYRLAKRLNLDFRAVARAGLLHDLFYYYPGEVTFSKGGHLRNHPYIALQNARVVTELSAKEEDIILKHMWLASPQLPRYRESFLVTFVDKYVAVVDFIEPCFKKAYFWCKKYMLRTRAHLPM